MAIVKNGESLASLEDWHRLAPPKTPNHWVADRSALEVARAWLEGGGIHLPQEVSEALSAHHRFGRVASWEAEPEVRLRFDTFRGEPRNTDLLVIAHDARGSYVVAVEAKADESYGGTVGDVFAAALERRLDNPRSKGIARIEGLVASLLRPKVPHTVEANEIRYQLLTACAGAVAEAERRGASRAVMLVHEFVTAETSDINHERNSADLARFLARLSGSPVPSISDGQLYGPFEVVAAKGVELFVGKVSRNLRRGEP
jgi:hypothetical protein